MEKQETILIADDAEINRAILRGLFDKEYNLLEAETGEQTLMLLRQYQDTISVVLLDLFMPGMDGYAVLEEMRRSELLYHVPVVVITADDSTDNRVKAFELGASDVIAKPFEPEVVKCRVRNIVELGRYRHRLETLVEEHSARAREANAAVIDMLSSVIEYRSLESGQHIRRIRMFTKILLEDVAGNCQEYGLDGRKIRLITDASSMHDIGKIAIPDSILNKPGRLTAEEFETMKGHTVKGCEIISGLGRLQDRDYLLYAYQICRHHHERWDGKGYPDGLKGDSTPICAQVVAIADCYDALTTDRVYKKAIPPNQAYNMILNGECGAFSPRLLECFKNVREAFTRLTREYADGLPAELSRGSEPAPEAPVWAAGANTLEQSQLKYFTLLRHLDVTVMEADLSTGVYHLVYLADRDFSALKSGGCFEESVRNFAQSAVHPDDRETALHLLGGYVQDFFDEGMTCRDQHYRVLERDTDRYVRCRVSMLRTNLEDPRVRRVLLVWRKEGRPLPPPDRAGADAVWGSAVIDQLLGGVQKCRCDRHFTLLHPSRSLLDLVGYSRREIEERFHNHMIELIYPPDRERVAREFRTQRGAGKVLELEYRLVAKDGRVVWAADRCMVAEEDGGEVAYCVLTDVTQSRQAEEELRLSLERHNIIMDQTNDIIFEWDIAKDTLYLSPNWEKQYGYPPITMDIREQVPKASHIHPDDLPVFMGLVEAMAAGVPYKEVEFRILDAGGRYRWRRVCATAQFDLDGKPYKAVGVILDIDAQKKESAELEERAARDALTGLYNHSAARVRVEEHLAACGPDDLSAMMLLDIDDFKLVNDRCGHMYGDAVLVEMSAKIAGLYRSQDTVARIGGDEFLVFMPRVGKREVAQQRAADMLSVLKNLLEEEQGGLPISCTIGLAFSTGEGTEYQTLFDHADRALYRAKAAGKNRYLCFQDEMREGPIGTALGAVAGKRTEIESDRAEQWDLPSLIIRSFDLLYSATDFYEAVQAILSLIGETFHISRTYIFESGPDGRSCGNTFEWCADGVQPQREFLQGLAYQEDGGDYRDNFIDGVFYCQNFKNLDARSRALLERQGVLSTLQYAIREDGVFHGFVGFDDCRVRRLWTREQIDALTFIGKLLSVFLLKARAQETLAGLVENLHSVLDHQKVWLYVLDPDTYSLRYVNGATRDLVPEARPGCPCFEAFYHRDRPCEDCVLARARETGQSTMELYNPYLDMWLLADAAMVEWDRRSACLVSCRDITAYKKGRGQSDGKEGVVHGA